MKCARCSFEIPEGSGFCPGCGLKVRREAIPHMPPTRPQTDASVQPGPPQPAAPPQQAGPTLPAAGGWGDATIGGQQIGPQNRGAPPAQQHPGGAISYSAPGDARAVPPPGYIAPGDARAVPPPRYDTPGRSYVGGGGAPPGFPGYPDPASGMQGSGNVDRDSLLIMLGILYVALLALVSTMMILFGDTSGSGFKALGVLFPIGIFSAVAVCGYAHIKRHTYEVLGTAVIVAAAVAAFFSCISIFNSSENLSKITSVVVLAAVLGAHTALILLMNSDKDWFRYSQYSAIIITWVTGLLLLAAEFATFHLSVSSYGSSYGSFNSSTVLAKAVGVFVVLDISVTIISILLWRLALRFNQ